MYVVSPSYISNATLTYFFFPPSFSNLFHPFFNTVIHFCHQTILSFKVQASSVLNFCFWGVGCRAWWCLEGGEDPSQLIGEWAGMALLKGGHDVTLHSHVNHTGHLGKEHTPQVKLHTGHSTKHRQMTGYVHKPENARPESHPNMCPNTLTASRLRRSCSLLRAISRWRSMLLWAASWGGGVGGLASAGCTSITLGWSRMAAMMGSSPDSTESCLAGGSGSERVACWGLSRNREKIPHRVKLA